jgi:hypothetical protein
MCSRMAEAEAPSSLGSSMGRGCADGRPMPLQAPGLAEPPPQALADPTRSAHAGFPQGSTISRDRPDCQRCVDARRADARGRRDSPRGAHHSGHMKRYVACDPRRNEPGVRRVVSVSSGERSRRRQGLYYRPSSPGSTPYSRISTRCSRKGIWLGDQMKNVDASW